MAPAGPGAAQAAGGGGALDDEVGARRAQVGLEVESEADNGLHRIHRGILQRAARVCYDGDGEEG